MVVFGWWAVLPPFSSPKFVFALESFPGQSQLLTCCYVVVVIPYYLSLGRVGGKGDWGEGSQASGLGCTATGRRTTAVGSYTASARSTVADLLPWPIRPADDAIKSL